MDVIFCVLIPYCLISIVVHFILHQLNVWDKWKIVIEKKKDQKYLTKVDPIYRVEKMDYTNGMFVYKYELGWNNRESIQIWLLLIPLPIEILYFEYQYVGSHYACQKKEIIEFFSERTLEDFYEQRQREEDIENLEKEEKNNYINKLNKLFEENYDK